MTTTQAPGKWRLKDHDAEQRLFNRRLATAGVLVVLLFAALVAKLINLQISQYAYFSARSDDNRLHSQFVPPPRGLVFDRSGELLADNQPIFNLTVVRERVDDVDATFATLRELVRLDEDDIEQFHVRARRNRVPWSSVPLRYVLAEEEIARVSVNAHRLPGIAIEPQFVRSYPLGSLTAHSVGYVSEINREELDGLSEAEKENYGGTNLIGKTGIERTYEHILHGSVGYELVEKNNRGQVMRRLERTEPIAGNNLTLHLESRLQIAAEEALGDFRGAVVAIEPETGGILAMVSKPAFDPNLFVTGISTGDYARLVSDHINTPLFDRTTNPYPPGSTIKPFLALGGLHTHIVDYEHAINDPGYFRLPGVAHRWGDWTLRSRAGGGHGHTLLNRAIYQSCDTFFYDLGNRMGIDAMHDFMALFGFGDNLVLDVPYARTGVLPSPDWKRETRGEPWYPGDTINASIGQGYMWATPMQLATAAAILANKGRMVRPRLLKEVAGVPHAPVAAATAPDVMLEDADYWRYVQDAMTMVVHRPYSNTFRDYGTAYEAIAMADPEMAYRMAGKSGSAQVVAIDQSIMRSEDIDNLDLHKDHALFIAFAPALHEQVGPKIAISVLVENGESGSNVAGPIAKAVIDTYLLDVLQLDFAAMAAESESESDTGARLVSRTDD